MDMRDKYLGIWITRAELEDIFDTVSTLGERDIFPDIGKERPRRLIRWDYIRSAEMFDDKMELERVVGFPPT